MNLTEIITALVAVYGAILSTYMLIVQLRKDNPTIEVKMDSGLLGSSLGTSGWMIILSASNPGQKAVTLSSQGIKLPNKRMLICPVPRSDVSFPYELLPEKSCRVFFETKEIAQALTSEGFHGKVRLIGFYRDQVDRMYESKPCMFDIDDWGK